MRALYHSDSCGPASGHRVEDELVVGCAGLVPASVPGMRVSVGLGVSEVSSDPVTDRRPRRGGEWDTELSRDQSAEQSDDNNMRTGVRNLL